MVGSIYRGTALEAAQPPLEAVQAALLLLALVNGIHTVLELLACCLGGLALLTLLFDGLQTPTVVVVLLGRLAVLEVLELAFKIASLLPPGIAIGLDLVGLLLEVGQGLLERLCQLALSVEVLLNSANASLLVLGDLRDVDIVLARRANRGR